MDKYRVVHWSQGAEVRPLKNCKLQQGEERYEAHQKLWYSLHQIKAKKRQKYAGKTAQRPLVILQQTVAQNAR